jgi:pyruvate,water dikinase
MTEGRLSIDTDVHPRFPVYSAGNFGEVAPERLSIAAWSLIGDPVERGCRALAQMLWPRATWYTGSLYVFVGYFRCRPYHNLSAFCHMGCEVPGTSVEDVIGSYFEDAPEPERPKGVGAGALGRAGGVWRIAREGVSLRGALTEAEGRVHLLEEEARRAVDSGSEFALGACWERAGALLPDIWKIHYTTTLGLVPLRAAQRGIGRRALGYWPELEPWLNRPQELVWSMLHDASQDPTPLAAGEFLDRAFYEVADEHEPWATYATRHGTGQLAEPAAERDDLREVAWGILPRSRRALLPQLDRLVSDTMSSRENSKSMAMRCMHVFRRLLPLAAESAGVAAADWPYLTVGELDGSLAPAEAGERAARRRAECERALAEEAPELVAPGVRGGAPIAAPEREKRFGRGRGVSPGLATGVVVSPSSPQLDGDLNGARRILVCDSADADIQPLLPQMSGVITARGSALSHVSILAREYGVPAVVGHALARELKPGQEVSLDGTTGEVTVIGD